jgi:hypothetical protein
MAPILGVIERAMLAKFEVNGKEIAIRPFYDQMMQNK